MTPHCEIDLHFLVPPEAITALAAELTRGATGGERDSVAELHLDTSGRHLARAGLAWCLRREGRRWIQCASRRGDHAHERLVHEAIRPDATWDAEAHAGTTLAAPLHAALKAAAHDGEAVAVVWRAELRRTLRRVRGRAAVVDLRFDDGRLRADATSLRVRTLCFSLVSGPAAALAALAERWRKRFGLVLDAGGRRERGDLLGRGIGVLPLRKAAAPVYDPGASALAAFGAVLDECLDQINRNAAGLGEGATAQRVEHVHQLRVGIRRLRSALRCFDGWVPAPPAALVEPLRALFAQLGQAREQDVMDSGVATELLAAGAPPLALPAATDVVDPTTLVRAPAAQQRFVAWIAWRLALLDPAPAVAPVDLAPDTSADAAAEAATVAEDLPVDLVSAAGRRLLKWHRRIAADGKAFDTLDEPALHALRKRIKRQRYAVEFLAPLLRRRAVARYLDALARLQDQMGRLNDLFVARARYQTVLDAHPTAWFALGWISARIVEVRAGTLPELRRLAGTPLPKGWRSSA